MSQHDEDKGTQPLWDFTATLLSQENMIRLSQVLNISNHSVPSATLRKFTDFKHARMSTNQNNWGKLCWTDLVPGQNQTFYACGVSIAAQLDIVHEFLGYEGLHYEFKEVRLQKRKSKVDLFG